MEEQLKESLIKRRSVRKYKDKAVDDKLFKEIIAEAAYAPSWKNSQTARYIVIKNQELKERIAENCVMDFDYNKKTILRAPALVLVTTITGRSGFERDGSPSTSKGSHWESFDAGIATQTFCLSAYNKGLGTVVLGIYDEKKVIEEAGVPEGQKVSAMIAIGYPDEEPNAPKRKDVKTLLLFKK